MGSACGIKSSNITQQDKTTTDSVKEIPNDGGVETEFEGIPLRRACIGHYFSEMNYGKKAEGDDIKAVWRGMCSSILSKEDNEPLFIHRKGIFVDTGLTETEAEIHLIAFAERDYSTFSKMLKAGPPSRYRWVAWKVALRVKSITISGLYEKLLKKKTPWIEYIDKDLNRTFPTHPLYSEVEYSQKGKTALRNILGAYAVYNKHVGYCQGMNFLAAFLLIISGFQEEDVFWSMVSLTNKKFPSDPLAIEGIEGLYSERLPLLRLLEKLFAHTLRDTLPAISEHLISIELGKELWLQKWISTLFLYSFSKGYCIRFWDFILTQGISQVFLLVLAILRDLKGQILNSDFVGCYELMMMLQENKDKILSPVDDLIAAAEKINLDWAKLCVLFKRYQDEVEIEDFEERKRKMELKKSERGDMKEDDNPQDTDRELRMEEIVAEQQRILFPEIKRVYRGTTDSFHKSFNKDHTEMVLPPIDQQKKTKFVFDSLTISEGEQIKDNPSSIESKSPQLSEYKGKVIHPIIEQKEEVKQKSFINRSYTKLAHEEELRSARMEDEDSIVFASLKNKKVQTYIGLKGSSSGGIHRDRTIRESKARVMEKPIFI